MVEHYTGSSDNRQWHRRGQRLTLGTTTISYILAAGCSESALVHVYPLPQVFTVTGGGSYCNGGTGVHIGLSGSATGVNYLLYRGSTATGTFAGTGLPLDFGLQTVETCYSNSHDNCDRL
jgi:hypothetical protein